MCHLHYLLIANNYTKEKKAKQQTKKKQKHDVNPKVKRHTKHFYLHIIKWTYIISWPTAHFMCGLMSGLSVGFVSIERA